MSNWIKDEMIRLEEGGLHPEQAYSVAVDNLAASYDDWHTRAKERGYKNPLVASYFCQTCHWSENAHPRDECGTGFLPGDPEAYRAHNQRLGF